MDHCRVSWIDRMLARRLTAGGAAASILSPLSMA
jgi:hypothetical protein